MKKEKQYRFWIIITVILIVIAFLLFQKYYGFGDKDDIVFYSLQSADEKVNEVFPTDRITTLEDGLSTVRYDEDYGFDEFINQGGASSDEELVSYISKQVLSGNVSLSVQKIPFGCSTLSVNSEEGQLFGRNFDWQNSEALIILSHTDGNYASISTVDMDFITSGTSFDLNSLPDSIRSAVAMYAPLDGMNEKGLAVSVNMIQDNEAIDQNTLKPNLTTTTAIRLLLNKAANIDEAIELLNQYDMHSLMNMMVYFALADASGKSVVVEYIDNEMYVKETPAVTNFYLTEGEKYGIGTSQSHERYDILMKAYDNNEIHSMVDMRDALDSVSKDNFGEFESTEWSIVFNLQSGEVKYYHRENYQNCYYFCLNE